MEWAQEFLSCTTDKFFDVKKLGEKTIEQLSLEQLQQAPSSESNSIAIIVKHLSGNMVARWTDLFGSDGEKPGRNRDQEFEGGFATKEDLIACWETGWQVLFAALAALSHDDLMKTVTIRNEPHSVMKAIQRQLSHYSYHVGQIVYIGKQLQNEHWVSLSIPRGKSVEYNQEVFRRHSSEG
ncbi:DUF1572 domain-containing protein [Brevibacillus parabrevis]|uniref:DUF1572 family protein n=1 Tax=Brevibacillus parabrevis TaxID=54914 RepID=UPI001C234077|nr:DUF1572 family protein [Brevibacillus parabrevis]MBU8713557.1 DUF1572 domain-containing protein [Brevibacillus parabrevis]